MRLRDLRRGQGLSQQQAADHLGIPLRTYQNYERGINEPGVQMLCRLADLYGVTVDHVVGREDSEHESARDHMARRIGELRKSRGMSVSDVGEALSKSGKTISAWEVGRGQPDADALASLCELLDVPVTEFYPHEVSGRLSDNEIALLDSYRALCGEGRAIALDLVGMMAQSDKYRATLEAASS